MDIRSPDIMKTSMERRSISRRDIMKRTRKVFPFSFRKSTFFLHKKKPFLIFTTGHKAEKGHDEHYGHHEKHGKKGGSKHHKKWGHKKSKH